MSSSDEEELLLLALGCKRKKRRWWMHEINEKREHLGEYHRLCVEFISHEDSRTFSISFSVNSSAIPYCQPGKSVSKTQISAARRDLDWSTASARLLFDGDDDAVLHSTLQTPFRRGHRSLPAAAARVLCGRTLTAYCISSWLLSCPARIFPYHVRNSVRTKTAGGLKQLVIA